LSRDFFDFGGVERIAALIGAIEHRAAKEIAQLAFVKRLAFAWLYEIALDHDIRIAVQLDLQTFSEFACVVASHFLTSRFTFC
jgi:hypothetical protein